MHEWRPLINKYYAHLTSFHESKNLPKYGCHEKGNGRDGVLYR